MSDTSASQSPIEVDYITAMSKEPVVTAYAKWRSLSDVETICFEKFLPKQARILDLGCGTGRALTALGKNFANYVGVDASEAMISMARENHPQNKFIIGDILNTEFEPSSFDAVLLLHNVIDMLHPKARRTKLLRNVWRLLDLDGVLIASSHLRKMDQKKGYISEEYHGSSVSNYRSSLPEWCAEVEAAGLSVLLAMRDFRVSQSDWTYISARKV